MNIINLTPHELHIYDDERKPLVKVAPSGTVARIQTERILVEVLNLEDLDVAIPMYKTVIFGDPIGLPEPKPHTIYIVSGIFRLFYDRPDLYQPGELVRDGTGQPIGCIGLSR